MFRSAVPGYNAKMLKPYMLLMPIAGLVWAATPTFEVASIKPAPPSNLMQAMHGNARIGMKIDAARVDIANLTVWDLVRIAYAAKPYQIVAPAWMKGSQRWDIQAKLPEQAREEQIPAMLQRLLAERFKVAVHRETKEQAVYALVVEKNGPKMNETAAESAGSTGGHQANGHGSSMGISGDAKNVFLTSEEIGPVKVSPGSSGIRLEAEKASMAALADMLSRIVDRPVVDMTGLKGRYDIALDLSAESMRAIATTAGFAMAGVGPGSHGAAEGAPGDDGGSSVYQSLRQLGLKLESRRAPLEMVVVDHAEKGPTEN